MLTIIIPHYNASEKIYKLLAILEQCNEAISVLIVDDFSSKSSRHEIFRNVEEISFASVSFLTQNQGVGNARNIGLHEALSSIELPEYLYFLDADDWLYPDALKKMVAVAERDNADIVCGQITRFDGKNYTPHSYNRHFFKEARTLSGIHDFPELALCPTLCNKLVRRSLIEEHGLRFATERYYAEDFHFSLRAFLKAETISIIDEPVVYFEDLGGQGASTSLWNTNNPTRANNTLKSVKDMMTWLRGETGEPYTSMILFHSLYRLPRALKIMASGDDRTWADYFNRVRDWILSEFDGPVLPNEFVGKHLHKAPSALAVLLLQLVYEGKPNDARKIALADRKLSREIFGKLSELPCVTWGEGCPKHGKSLLQREMVSSEEEVPPSNVLTGWPNQLRQLAFYPAIASSGQFDKKYYCQQANGLFPALMPRIHYLLFGNKAGLSPASYFKPEQYYAYRPDVAEAKVDAFGHFVKYGIFEL